MPPLKVLVVEDDLACLELMTEVFTSLKAEVRAVGKSEKAAAMVNQEKFDGIFLDLEMPTLSGFDLARLIRKSSWNKSTPIVIVTGSDERKTMQDAFAIGATFFIQKPVDRQKLSVLFRTVSGGMLENRRKPNDLKDSSKPSLRRASTTSSTDQDGSTTSDDDKPTLKRRDDSSSN